MLCLCYRRFQLLLARRCSTAAVVDSVNNFHCFQKGSLLTTSLSSKPLLGIENDEKARSFTVLYLVNKCGLSPEQALSVSKNRNIRFKSPENPDLVIKILKHYGFTDAHILQIAKKLPKVFLSDAEKTLLPKLEFFRSIGISGTALAGMLCSSPNVFTLSLERRLKPCYDFTRLLRIPQEKVPFFIASYCHRSFTAEQIRNIASNVSVLLAHGVPESSCPLWVHHYATALSFKSDKVKENVNKVISMGLSPSCPSFMKALYVISVTDASRWEQKVDFYKKWGWTEEGVLLAFRKNPLFMGFNEKNISIKLDFILNKMGYQPADVARYPPVLTTSLKKRIIPRCSVVRVLLLKGLIKREEYSISTLLISEKKYFLDTFVIKYQEQVPELPSIFEGKMGLEKLGLGFEEASGVEQV